MARTKEQILQALQTAKNYMLTRKYGREVRNSLGEVAQACYDAIDQQVAIVTTDLTDTDPNAAAQAATVGGLISGLDGEVMHGFNTAGYSPENPFGILDVPQNHYAAFVTVEAFADLPENLPEYDAGVGRFCIYRLRSSVHDSVRSLVVFYDQIANRLYLNGIKHTGETTSFGKWDKFLCESDVKQIIASDLGAMKQFAFANETGINYYKTKIDSANLEEIDTSHAWTTGYNIQPDGSIKAISYIAATLNDDVFFPSGPNITYYFGGSKFGRSDGHFYVFLHEYDANGQWLRRTGFLHTEIDMKVTPVTTGENCASVRFVFAYNAASNLTMTQDDIDKYAVFYKEVTSE